MCTFSKSPTRLSVWKEGSDLNILPNLKKDCSVFNPRVDTKTFDGG